ncbi:hypothetical protein M8756_14000 [Lutimaribacter sp. EGI FJ00015]|uniref:hypothetical protein n=1 Tax=Lutimaribacter degradans TaxID=2945989 RepID=UPI002041F91C|nr:hypothetical protein [Lutimaribacter sp. EGI FJ00013]MCO0614428.1 hypothetical protein [Lutimaribacter sp. EGI FJ00015]
MMVAGSILALSACGAPPSGSSDAPALPDAVLELAAPNQDLSSARLRPEDGCYWYVHEGPVETTLLPLRTTGGNPICTRAAAT